MLQLQSELGPSDTLELSSHRELTAAVNGCMPPWQSHLKHNMLFGAEVGFKPVPWLTAHSLSCCALEALERAFVYPTPVKSQLSP